ncbi:hypothetical protein [Morganella sp. EGD-HP17]|uniref:hypothetical protein n=1 Tax=Morganella sp. EGD-HP17 TaxID=1435146 RepID=UPI0003FFA5B4|nr:hypothetical protein [Morganella sp. EGD-HP17]ETO41222.1 hypothetical protein X965_11280 [Morganella sp. EGD-HP17]
MRILLIILLLFSSLARADVINPFRLLSSLSPEQRSLDGDLPVDSDCLLRPQFHGALPSVAYIQGAYFGYVNRCYWEAVSDVSTQSVSGASVAVIAWWSPRNRLPDHDITAGDTCRKKEAYPNVQFSDAWQDYDGYYANYDGCLYYSYCSKSRCESPSNYSGRYTPIGESDIRHPPSKMTAGGPDDDFPLVSGYKQPWPEGITAGQMVNGATLLEYYAYVYQDYCDYVATTGPGKGCRYGYPPDTLNPPTRLPLKKLSHNSAGKYECYAWTLEFPQMGDDVCTIMTAEEDEINGKLDLTLQYSHLAYLSGVRQESDLYQLKAESSANGMMLDEVVNLNHEMLAELKKIRKTTDQTQKDVKNIGTGSGSGGGTTGGNYHGDIQKFNDDMNANHNALMEKLSEKADGEGIDIDTEAMKEQYELGMEAYGKGTLDEVQGVLDSMFDNLPDLTLAFELPPEFYGRAGRPPGSCIPLKRHTSLDFTQGVKAEFDFDTSTACDYYDDYFRRVVEFGLYFLTALACFRMYHRNVGKE